LNLAATRFIPHQLFNACQDLLCRIAKDKNLHRILPSVVKFALSILKKQPAFPEAAFIILYGLCREVSRSQILEEKLSWEPIWSTELSPWQYELLLEKFQPEMLSHEDGSQIDADLAYFVDIFSRIIGSNFLSSRPEIIEKVKQLLDRAAQLYDSVASHKPDLLGPPQVDDIINQMPIPEERDFEPF